jgi:hypothetical protein
MREGSSGDRDAELARPGVEGGPAANGRDARKIC